MIGKTIWIIGNTESGKTFTAKYFKSNFQLNFVHLDGDDMRKIWTDLGLSKEDRYEQNLRIARLSKLLNSQGYNVLISSICPYKELRTEVTKICNCDFIYVTGGKTGEEYPFEIPDSSIITIKGQEI